MLGFGRCPHTPRFPVPGLPPLPFPVASTPRTYPARSPLPCATPKRAEGQRAPPRTSKRGQVGAGTGEHGFHKRAAVDVESRHEMYVPQRQREGTGAAGQRAQVERRWPCKSAAADVRARNGGRGGSALLLNPRELRPLAE
eukprot:gene11053-biopygen7818